MSCLEKLKEFKKIIDQYEIECIINCKVIDLQSNLLRINKFDEEFKRLINLCIKRRF